ncbi:sugar ABC transporter substrate-binding protein [Pelagibacterium montanilacus]|uniref:sugar ABC transporter substrate-binding protein n=1 Tax=Pelagibacterium montanilacus TaxID=2185280 RepID=UPI001FECFAA6|nr:sugar ABC transporter substrate-binding protein [Pelagibacterium montanilacus]
MSILDKRTVMMGVATGVLAMGLGLPATAQELPEGATVEAVENTEGPIRIAFMAFQNNPFWTPVTEGAEAAREYLADFDVTVDYIDMGDNMSAEAVIASVESAIAQQYDGIVTVPVFDGTERIINEAVAEGIPVVNIIAEGSQPSDRLFFMGQDATAAGAQLGEFMAGEMEGDGKLGVITGLFGATQHSQRMNGALDYLAENHPEIEIIGPFENQDAAETAYSLVQDMYTANNDLEMVYVTAGGPFGAAKAIQDLGLTGEVGVVGFDHTPENTTYIDSGEMAALIDQAPFQQAFDATVMLYNHLVTGEGFESDYIPVEGNILTPDGML